MVLTKEQADQLFLESINNGLDQDKDNMQRWTRHSQVVADTAFQIAAKVDGLSADKAYSLGLLHDIGRRYGKMGLRHVILGYQYMNSLTADENARICLTHSYPFQNAKAFSGKNDCSEKEFNFLIKTISNIDYNDYDRLIQLCDGISLPEGAVTLEKRLVENAIRNGFNEYTIDKWKAYLDLKSYFDRKCKCNIYDLI